MSGTTVVRSDNSALSRAGIKIGQVFRVEMTRENGIIPKQGDTSRNKFFVVLGFDSEGNIYGGVIFNSAINQHLTVGLRDLQMPVSCDKYPFLRKDSFIDCSKLKETRIEQIAKSKCIGNIDRDDLELIIGTVINSPIETRANLLRFGLTE